MEGWNDHWSKFVKKREERNKTIDWKWVVYFNPHYYWKIELGSSGVDRFDPLQTYQIENYPPHMGLQWWETYGHERLNKKDEGKYWFIFDTEEEARELYDFLNLKEKSKEIYTKKKDLIELTKKYQDISEELKNWKRYKTLTKIETKII
jgi:hypothetical protein